MTGLTIDLELLAGRQFGDLFTHTGGESMYQNSGLRVPPEMFNNAKNKVLGNYRLGKHRMRTRYLEGV
jgi:hypothetical protein